MADPRLENPPNYAGPDFIAIRQGLIAGRNENEEQVINNLITAWEADRARRAAAWDEAQQLAAQQGAAQQGAAPQGAVQQARGQQEGELVQPPEVEAEAEPRDLEKKKSKMNTFEPGTSVSTILGPRPSNYALRKLESGDYVELWYFSPEGHADAERNSSRSQADDTYGLTKVDDLLTVRSINALKASRNALRDHELSFEAFLQAKNNLLFHAKKADWPTSNLDALATFFWRIETHPMRKNVLGNQTVLSYAARVRRDWHDELKAGRGYDISVINEELMHDIAFEMQSNDHLKMRSKVT